MKAILRKVLRHKRRKRHVRKKVNGTAAKPRLCVFRSHKNIYVQIIDDVAGRTLVSVSSMTASLRGELDNRGGNKAAAKAVGTALAAEADKAGIKQVVFDRSGYAFHGRVRELAQAACDSGLKL